MEGSVWVVDDDDGYRDLLEIVLQTHCGFRAVRGFGRGEDAVHALQALPPDGRPAALLLDFHMPGMNGLGVLRALRPLAARPSIVVLSSAVTPQERAECTSEGALSFIEKPTRVEELIRALRQWRDALPPGPLVDPHAGPLQS